MLRRIETERSYSFVGESLSDFGNRGGRSESAGFYRHDSGMAGSRELLDLPMRGWMAGPTQDQQRIERDCG